MSKPGRIKISQLFGVIVSVLMLVWLGYTYDWNELVEPLSRADYEYLLIIPLLIIPNYIARAFRWRSLIDKSETIGITNIFKALMTGYLFNNIIPARAGDIVRVYHLNKNEGKSKSHLFASLIAERLGDMLFLMCLLSLVLISYPGLPTWLKNSGFVAGVVTLSAFIVLWIIYWKGKIVIPAIIARLTFLSDRIANRLNEMTGSALTGLKGLFHFNSLFYFTLLTVLLWVLEVITAYIVAEAFGLNLAFGNILFIIIVITIGTLIPSSPGFIGTYEFFGVQALQILGVSGGSALSFVIVLHAVNWLAASIIGGICLMSWKGQRGSGL